jgi:hypothetical protein
MEDTMNKPLIALATAAIALSTTALTSSAEAGFGIRIGFGAFHAARMHFEHRDCNRHVYIARHERERVYVAKRHAHIPVVASQDETPAPAPETTADNENSSITTAALDQTATPDASAEAATDATPATTDTPAATTDTSATSDATPANSTPAPTADATAPATNDTSANAAPVAPQKVAEVKSSDCKAFFPAIGMTLTVPCQK